MLHVHNLTELPLAVLANEYVKCGCATKKRNFALYLTLIHLHLNPHLC